MKRSLLDAPTTALPLPLACPAIPLDSTASAAFVMGIEAKLAAADAAENAPYCESDRNLEIDSDSSTTTLTYRVWQGMQQLGEFYRSPSAPDSWVAIAYCCRLSHNPYPSATAAQNAILEAYNLTGESII